MVFMNQNHMNRTSRRRISFILRDIFHFAARRRRFPVVILSSATTTSSTSVGEFANVVKFLKKNVCPCGTKAFYLIILPTFAVFLINAAKAAMTEESIDVIEKHEKRHAICRKILIA